MNNKKISILVDNDSWIIPYVHELVEKVSAMGYDVSFCQNAGEVEKGEVNFILGCVRIVPDDVLLKNKFNIVIHESNLPEGKGFAPMSWQILNHATEITICLLEASSNVDSGRIYLKDVIKLEGHELSDEWRKLQGEKTVDLCMEFLKRKNFLYPKEQKGQETFFQRRTPKDSQIDPNKTIIDQFNLFRVVDNNRYPAFFDYNGVRYILKIFKDE